MAENPCQMLQGKKREIMTGNNNGIILTRAAKAQQTKKLVTTLGQCTAETRC